MARTGRPQTIEDGVQLGNITVPRDVRNAIDALVTATDLSKSSVVRMLLISALQASPLADATLTDSGAPTTFTRSTA